MSDQVYNCSLCDFAVPTKPMLLSHIRLIHSNDPRFVVTCGIGGCVYTAKKFSTYYSHIYRKHPNSGYISRNTSEVERLVSPEHENVQYHLPDDLFTQYNEDIGVESTVNELVGRDDEVQRRSSALFILKLKEARRVSQVVVDDVVEELSGLFEHSFERLKAGISSTLATAGVDVEYLGNHLDNVFSEVSQPFANLETRYKQEKYFREHLGLVEPVEVKIGDPYHVPKYSGSKRRLVEISDSFHYVPILQSLSVLLQDASVLEQIDCLPERVHTDGTLEDFCDGELFRSHPILSQDSRALQVIAFYDELELCNPLGTHVKTHKLGIVLFTLGNFHPRFRSSLRVINLVIAATVPIIEKYGMDEILKPFIRDIKELESSGISVLCQGRSRKFYGCLLVFLADNLASHALGGFKESFSFAVRICRSCNATNESYRTCFNSNGFDLRCESQHEAQCQQLHGPLQSHYSKCYGINRRSSLMHLHHFKLVEGGLPHDAMHDVFEGVASREVVLLLRHCITDEKYFTLEEYNNRLVRFDYGYSETDKPFPITHRSFSKNSLRISASQMILLLRILPLIIGDKVPENDSCWKCFLTFLQIVDIVLCPMVSYNMCGYLKVLIEEHHTQFASLYTPQQITPKFHYLIHYPDQIISTGPLVRSWNMRNEAKLNFFKRATHIGNNFKNISFSLASRHQRLLCYELSSGEFLKLQFQCGPCPDAVTLSSETSDIISSIKSLLPEISTDISLSRPSWIQTQDMLIKRDNCYIIIGKDIFCPTFGKIDDIIVLKGFVIVLLLRLCNTMYFDSHIHSYKIEHSSSQKFILLHTVEQCFIVHSHYIQGNKFVYLKWYVD